MNNLALRFLGYYSRFDSFARVPFCIHVKIVLFKGRDTHTHVKKNIHTHTQKTHIMTELKHPSSHGSSA